MHFMYVEIIVRRLCTVVNMCEMTSGSNTVSFSMKTRNTLGSSRSTSGSLTSLVESLNLSCPTEDQNYVYVSSFCLDPHELL